MEQYSNGDSQITIPKASVSRVVCNVQDGVAEGLDRGLARNLPIFGRASGDFGRRHMQHGVPNVVLDAITETRSPQRGS
jgi:hypothetical protein